MSRGTALIDANYDLWTKSSAVCFSIWRLILEVRYCDLFVGKSYFDILDLNAYSCWYFDDEAEFRDLMIVAEAKAEAVL